jgi:hypothetical protein
MMRAPLVRAYPSGKPLLARYPGTGAFFRIMLERRIDISGH